MTDRIGAVDQSVIIVILGVTTGIVSAMFAVFVRIIAVWIVRISVSVAAGIFCIGKSIVIIVNAIGAA